MWVRRLSLLNVVVNVMIVVTGGAVRLTGSGLGCPSWPNCQPGAFHVTPAMGIHGYIEWGNRLFGVVVGVVAAATLLATILRRPRRASLIRPALLVAVGVPAQALIGMITVETGLNPWVVSCHFLVTIAVLAAAYTGYVRAGEPDGEARPVVPGPFRLLAAFVVAAALVTIVVGVLVTGSGPHAGDPASPRIPLDSALLAQLHADSVFLLIGLTVGAVLAAAALRAPRRVRTALWVLTAVEIGQSVIGFVQFFTGLPVILVGAHMLGAALLWLAALHVLLTCRERTGAPEVPAQERRVATEAEPEAAATP
ncbi:cytochrome c oxidase assembly protein subunit 15 [Stackebrandtia albiflava]|uniref:Cytochrome c oxidase assembly protein subunit 15 n=1 Tax=Stackebrandtia albiflava TaxID=406432 RepID=A0A562VD59_9ACTN|nr:COX15/CtaA family protein [Stackebrandtia albiflava]TWJ15810.1 cytochrome c oxidase assembly protein subunit 15 [Stackebrandtia albiflava]